MHTPDMEKLRRFSLVLALITLGYSLGGVSLTPGQNLLFLGIPLTISRPNLLPISLLVASVFTTIRFYFYGFMLKKSPYRVRRDFIDALHCHTPPYLGKKKKVPIYWGPTEFIASLSSSTYDEAKAYVANFPEVFPKFAQTLPRMKIESSDVWTENGDHVGTAYDVIKVVIPIRCRMAAIFQDFDYSSPVWLNLFSLITFFFLVGLRD